MSKQSVNYAVPSPMVTTVSGCWHRSASSARSSFHHPIAVAVDGEGNLYVTQAVYQWVLRLGSGGDINVIAGSRDGGFADGAGASARFSKPDGITLDGHGNLYVADGGNRCLRKIDRRGSVTTLVDREVQASNEGRKVETFASMPASVAVGSGGELYFADKAGHRIRRLRPDGEVETVAGSTTPGLVDGPREMAAFREPHGIALASNCNLYVADQGNHCIRMISPDGMVVTIAGDGTPGYIDGYGQATRFNKPMGVAVDSLGTVYVADTANTAIRRITPDGQVTTLAGRGFGSADGPGRDASFKYPMGIAISGDGALYIADSGNHCIRKLVLANALVVLAGSGEGGHADDVNPRATFFMPRGIASDGRGGIYVADTCNHAIRLLSPDGTTRTIAGTGRSGNRDGPGEAAEFFSPTGIAVDHTGVIYVADTCNDRIRRVEQYGQVETIAGGAQGWADGQGAAARFHAPAGLAPDLDGNLYVADSRNHCIRCISPDGVVTTLAGSVQRGFKDDVGQNARFHFPRDVVVDQQGRVYVADSWNHCIRLIDPDGLVRTLAGDGRPGSSDGPGYQASFYHPRGLALDRRGRLYVADGINHRIRVVTPDGLVTTLAGGNGRDRDDDPGDSNKVNHLKGLAVDDDDRLYIADARHHRIYVTLATATGREPARGVPGGGMMLELQREAISGNEPARVDPLSLASGNEPAIATP